MSKDLEGTYKYEPSASKFKPAETPNDGVVYEGHYIVSGAGKSIQVPKEDNKRN